MKDMTQAKKIDLPVLLKGFLRAVLISSISLWAAQYFYPLNLIFATAALVAIGLGTLFEEYLEENKNAIWTSKESPYSANARLALQITVLFVGVLLTASIAFAVAGIPESVAQSQSNDLFRANIPEIFKSNLTQLVAATVIALIFRAGGLMLVLAWNAITWSCQFASYFALLGGVTKTSSIFLVGTFLAHSVVEVVAYVLAGMSGIFISKGLSKYSTSSPEMNRVAKASLFLLVISAIVLFLSAILEVVLTGSFGSA